MTYKCQPLKECAWLQRDQAIMVQLAGMAKSEREIVTEFHTVSGQRSGWV